MAQEQGKLYITISDTRVKGTGSGNGLIKTTVNDKEGGSNDWGKLESYAAHEAIHFLKAETIKMINYQVSTYGDRTGNYLAQSNTQASLGLASQGIGIGMTAWTGAKIGMSAGPIGAVIGAVIGAGIGITSFVINTHLELENHRRQIRYQNTNIAMIRQRAGLDNLNDGSRGTEN